MANEVTKKEQHNLDGFTTFEDGVEGGDEQISSRRIQGLQVKFSNDFRWLAEDEEFPVETELVASDIVRVAQRWGKDKTQGPIEDKELGPYERFPDFDKLNAGIPQSEWLEGFDGKPRGPWQGAFFLYLLDDSNSLDQFTYIANLGTVGACIAIRELADKVEWMRIINNNQKLYAVVKLSDTFMNTRFGGRQRPHFKIVRWVMFGGGGGDRALPPTEAPQLSEVKAPDSAEQTLQQGMQTVAPPTAKEATGDEIPF